LQRYDSLVDSWQEYLVAGQAGLSSADWSGPKAQFEDSLRQSESPEAHDGLGIALWWLNKIAAAHRHRTIAYKSYKQEGELLQAGVVAS